VIRAGIVAEKREICHVTARFHAVRDGPNKTHAAGGNAVHVRSLSHLKGGFPAKLLERVITHPVTNENDVLGVDHKKVSKVQEKEYRRQ